MIAERTDPGLADIDIAIDVIVEVAGWPTEEDLTRLARAAVTAAVETARLQAVPGAEVAIFFADDARLRTLNGEWRGRDAPTNVLSFEGSNGSGPPYGPLLGDIVLALETVTREAEEQGKRFEHHLSHLMIHGLLHLFGYDHQIEAEAEVMEDAERRALARLGIADPYADAPLAGRDDVAAD